MRLRLAMIWMCWFAGCAHRPVSDVKAVPPLLRLSPASLGTTLSHTSQLTFTKDGASTRVDAILQVDEVDVRLAAVAYGQTVLKVVYDGKTLQEEHSPRLPPTVDAARVLSDVQLVWWPLNAIRTGLPVGCDVTQNETLRTLSCQGKDWITVQYDGMPPTVKRATLRHLVYHYEFVMEAAPP